MSTTAGENRSCHTKRRYRDRNAATKAGISLLRRTGQPMVCVYECPVCGLLHLTSQRKALGWDRTVLILELEEPT